jgi:hypothetical protein
MFQLQLSFLLHCDEWDRIVALLRHKFVTGATLLQLVKLVKCDHRNRMKRVTLNNILHVKLNCNKQCYEHVSNTVVDKFFRVKDRKIEFYLG